ncbi:MAG: hypothetical protein EPN19_15300 [Betaproteobacteria bacterium]|nr:MAG: hypothetical protein EPN19_15300 [Betaproteobacteria bacterium]
MQLEKWYADYVADDEAHVFYRANLRLGPVTLGHVGALASAGPATGRFVLGSVALPTVDGGTVSWPVDGRDALRWSGAQARVFALHRNADFDLSWNPWVLNGTVNGGARGSARGYVECLRMNFSPWRLGLRVLRWGRFCGARESLAWIEWQGDTALRLLLVNGEPAGLESLSRTEVRSTQGHVLHFEAPRKFGGGPLARYAFGALPGASVLAAARFFRGVQERWLCSARLSTPLRESDAGCAVFEEVHWP